MEEKMIRVAGVRFRENWKVYDFDTEGVDVAVGVRVVVDTERGPGLATVVRIKNQVAVEAPPVPEPVVKMEQGLQIEEEIDGEGEPAPAPQDKAEQGPKPLRKVLRTATEDDLAREERNIGREAEAFKIAQDLITERDLPMKLIRVEYSFDASRATFFFFSETRVDFRELVKDLAYKLKSRIEMRQIGVRDVARMIGGFGPCGRELCCSSFLKNFEPVSIRMAKKQEMVLNPAKISGVCGRLLCCLSYEYPMYDEIKKDIAGMKEAVVKEKERKEEERRISEERRETEERRQAEEKRRQEERKQQEQRREKQKEEQKSRQEKKKEPQQEKKGQQQQRQRQQQQQPPEQKGQQPQPPEQEGEKPAKKKKRRFWRRKKKGQQGEGSAPPKTE
ncbi:MAG TPA: regulatory iron-sulfur-containing complex subunit RicT [Nitrospirota bacterium]|nr:regulatory iron-sulfur-containing complex subunit RicT [Nitrospirota bacterium]